MKSLQLASTITKLKDLEDRLIKTGKTIKGIFFIKIWDFEINHFVPVIFVTDSELIIQIGEKSLEYNIKDIKEYKLIDGKDTPLKLLIIFNDEEIKLSLVKIDDKLSNPEQSYTHSFFDLLETVLTKKEVPQSLTENLPDQRTNISVAQQGLPLIVASLLMISLSFLFHAISVSLGWIVLIAGIIVGLLGIFLIVAKGRLF